MGDARIFRPTTRMPDEAGVYRNPQKPVEGALMPWPPKPSPGPLTVHSVMTPADARAIRDAEYPRSDWNDVKNLRNRRIGGD